MPLFDNTGRLVYDACAVQAKNHENCSAMQYRLFDIFNADGKTCGEKVQKLNSFAMTNRNLRFKDGFGVTCAIDADSASKYDAVQTNDPFKRQLYPRVFGAVPDLSRGKSYPEVEARMIHGQDTSSDKQCNRITEQQWMRSIPCVDVQRVDNVIPKWQWGGAPSRDIARSEEFLTMLGYKHDGTFWSR